MFNIIYCKSFDNLSIFDYNQKNMLCKPLVNKFIFLIVKLEIMKLPNIENFTK